MQDIPLGWLFALLVVLVSLSAFFSSTETALMSINRYRLRHRAREGSSGARAAEKLLEFGNQTSGEPWAGGTVRLYQKVNVTAGSCFPPGCGPKNADIRDPVFCGNPEDAVAFLL